MCRVRNPACTATSTLGKECYINGLQTAPLTPCMWRYINEVHITFIITASGIFNTVNVITVTIRGTWFRGKFNLWVNFLSLKFFFITFTPSILHSFQFSIFLSECFSISFWLQSFQSPILIHLFNHSSLLQSITLYFSINHHASNNSPSHFVLLFNHWPPLTGRLSFNWCLQKNVHQMLG